MADVVLDTAKLDAMIAQDPGKLADVVGKTCFRILAEARMITPRDPARPPKDIGRKVSGALRANSDVVKVDAKGLTQRVEYYQEYAVYQEFGAPAINLPARPFLTPTVEKNNKQFVDDIIKVVNE
jgi:DICT domain-containing protein